jgi:hypothetical protein
MKRVVIIEGGGGRDNKSLTLQLQQAFHKLLNQCASPNKQWKIIAKGSRRACYETFVHLFENKEAQDKIILLVDSEAAYTTDNPWEHVAQRVGDGWEKPKQATNAHLFFMVTSMENWLLTINETSLKAVFGSLAMHQKLNCNQDIEAVSKQDALSKLSDSILKTSQGKDGYDKGKHSFKLLERLDNEVLKQRSAEFNRLCQHLRK